MPIDIPLQLLCILCSFSDSQVLLSAYYSFLNMCYDLIGVEGLPCVGSSKNYWYPLLKWKNLSS